MLAFTVLCFRAWRCFSTADPKETGKGFSAEGNLQDTVEESGIALCLPLGRFDVLSAPSDVCVSWAG